LNLIFGRGIGLTVSAFSPLTNTHAGGEIGTIVGALFGRLDALAVAATEKGGKTKEITRRCLGY
jgi:hypothetical protein